MIIPKRFNELLDKRIILSVHYIAGLAVAEEKFKYVKSFMSMVDAIIVVAVLIDSLLHWNNISTNRDNVNFSNFSVDFLFSLD